MGDWIVLITRKCLSNVDAMALTFEDPEEAYSCFLAVAKASSPGLSVELKKVDRKDGV